MVYAALNRGVAYSATKILGFLDFFLVIISVFGETGILIGGESLLGCRLAEWILFAFVGSKREFESAGGLFSRRQWFLGKNRK